MPHCKGPIRKTQREKKKLAISYSISVDLKPMREMCKISFLNLYGAAHDIIYLS